MLLQGRKAYEDVLSPEVQGTIKEVLIFHFFSWALVPV